MKLDYIECGDCLELFKNIPDKSIDLIVTDPPYKVTSRGNAGNSGGMLQKDINKKGQVFEYNDISCKDYAKEFYRVLKDDTHCYVMTNHKNLIEMLNVFTENGFKFIKCLIWDKGNKIMGQFYMNQYEYIMFFRKGKGIKINNCGTSDLIRIDNVKTKVNGVNLHDTEKPINLMKILIENSSKIGDVVLDPFMGIGSTALACLKTNRHYIGFEIDKDYCEIANSRLKSVEKDNRLISIKRNKLF